MCNIFSNSCQELEMQERRNAGQEGCIGQVGCRTGGMQDKRDAGHEGGRKGGMQDRSTQHCLLNRGFFVQYTDVS